VLICGECSTRNNDGESFCANCGAYLVWQGEQEKPSKNAKAGPESGPRDGKTVLMPKVPAPPDHGPASQWGTRRDQPSSVPRVTRLPGIFPEEEAAGVIRAEKPLKPATVDSTEPPPEVKPGRRTTPLEPGPPPLTDETPPAPGELICGRCGAGNSRERHYCRRCAASLHEAAVVPPLPWWRRLASPRPKAPLPAGTRPKRKRRHFPLKLVSFLAVLGLLGGAAYVGRDAIDAAVAQVQDRFLSSDKRAKSVTASSSQLDRLPDFAIDTFSDRSWAAAVAGNTDDQFLDFVFEREFRLTQIVITGGASNDSNVFIKDRRPRNVEVIAGQADGQTPIAEFAPVAKFELKDITESQSFNIVADRVSAVRVRILDSTGPEEAPVAIAEVQFSGR
jgi:hypothetical protein